VGRPSLKAATKWKNVKMDGRPSQMTTTKVTESKDGRIFILNRLYNMESDCFASLAISLSFAETLLANGYYNE
jgi:hypothetical protein